MRTLPTIKPTKDQLALIGQNRLGVEVIRGAAGSGKTTTALLRLRSLLHLVNSRFTREGIDRPVRVLVLTFNRTLSGYIRSLAEQEIKGVVVDLTIDTFARWAMNHLNHPSIVREKDRADKLTSLTSGLPLSSGYLMSEIDYLIGRFPPADLDKYVIEERTGRGNQPRVERALRREILDRIVRPYNDWLGIKKSVDWNGLAVQMNDATKIGYDVIIVDESQDFSANQIRAIKHHFSEEYAAVFVIDTVQRVYPRGFTWAETGIALSPGRSHTLSENHRNTKQIARFAAGVLSGLAADSDGAMPDLKASKRDGELPTVCIGKFSKQMDYAIERVKKIDLATESVAFLAPKITYLDYLRGRLSKAQLAFCELTREADWPAGPVNIAVCTFHSAKGLEFDHVFALGLNDEVTPHDDETRDDQLIVLRRLFAMAVARSKHTVVVGYKDGEQSALVSFFKSGTYNQMKL